MSAKVGNVLPFSPVPATETPASTDFDCESDFDSDSDLRHRRASIAAQTGQAGQHACGDFN